MKLLGILALAFTVFADGATVYDNGSYSTANAYTSDSDSVTSVDDFSFSFQQTIRQVRWWGINAFSNTPGDDGFTLMFFADNAGIPAAVPLHSYAVAATRTDTGQQLAGLVNIYAYEAAIPDTILNAGNYWISIVNNPVPTDYSWAWMISSTPGTAMQDGQIIANNLAFQLLDDAPVTVPEPATMLFSGAALLGMAWYRRARSTSSR